MGDEQRERVWYFDLVGAISAGTFIGFFSQFVAESGEIVPDRIVVPMLITGGSFLVAFLLTGKRESIRRIPRWIFVAVLGAIFCFVFFHTIYYAYTNWIYRHTSESFSEYLSRLIPDRLEGFILLVPIDILVVLPIMGIIHLVGRQFSKHVVSKASFNSLPR